MSPLVLFPLIFSASFVLTMVGLGGGLIFSPLFVLMHFPIHTALSAALFLNGTAASVRCHHVFSEKDGGRGCRRAPLGVYVTTRIPIRLFTLFLATVIFLAAATSIFVVVFSSFSGFSAHISIAAPNWRFIGLAAVCFFLGGQLGPRIMTERLKGAMVRRLLSMVLLVFVPSWCEGFSKQRSY